jgi:hypothetical protein
LIEAVPYELHTILTDNGIQFADLPRTAMAGPLACASIGSTRSAASMASSTGSPSEPSVDQQAGRADEPNHQGRHR